MKTKIDILTKWIKDEVTKTGKTGVVIGLSGGVDSSVAATLAVKALGKEKVFGLILPNIPEEEFTNKGILESCADAFILVNHLGINSYIYNIAHMSLPTSRPLNRNFPYLINIAPRDRMKVLYYYASLKDFLVLGTTNKTEMKLGYFTKWGDGAVDLEPLADVYKTDIFKIAKELNIPEFIINKPPSADLYKGQTDEEELGLTYEEIDTMLKAYEDNKNITVFNAEKNKILINIMKKNEHKTKPIPFCDFSKIGFCKNCDRDNICGDWTINPNYR